MNGDDELGAQPLGPLEQRLVAFDDHLGDAVAIADVDEQQRAEVADAVHPAEQDDVRADVGGAQRAAGMSASQRTELFSHVLRNLRLRQMRGARRLVGTRPCCSPVARVLTRHHALRQFVVADDGDERDARGSTRT